MLLQIDLLNSPTSLTLLFITFVKLNTALKKLCHIRLHGP